MFHVFHAVLSVRCSLVVTCWERANLLASFYVMFICVFVTLPCSVLSQLCYLIVSILDHCLLPYFGSLFNSDFVINFLCLFAGLRGYVTFFVLNSNQRGISNTS